MWEGLFYQVSHMPLGRGVLETCEFWEYAKVCVETMCNVLPLTKLFRKNACANGAMRTGNSPTHQPLDSAEGSLGSPMLP